MRLHLLQCSALILLLLAPPPRAEAADLPKPPPPGVMLTPATEKREEWYLGTTLGAYETVGEKNLKWDNSARAVLRAAACTWGVFPRHLEGDEMRTMLEGGDAAIRAGCTDPLVLYAHARAIEFFRRDPPAVVAKAHEQALAGFRTHKYPAVYRANALFRAAQGCIQLAPRDDKALTKARARIDEAIALLPEVFADKGIPTKEACIELRIAGDASEMIEKDREVYVKRVIPLLEQSPLPKSLVLTARGEEWETHVQNADAQVMAQRRENAKTLLEQAWELDNTNADAARAMLGLELYGGGGHDHLETWFERAVAADPDDHWPYETKMNWLEPKWYGSPQEMLAFGRECVKSGEWSAMAPMTLIDGYWGLATIKGNTHREAFRREYFLQNPQVWEEIKPIYDEYFKSPDVSNHHQTEYAVIAAYSGHWKEADAMFKKLQWRWAVDVLYNNPAMEALIKEVAAKATEIRRKEAGASTKPVE